jgi:hypothetical protein
MEGGKQGIVWLIGSFRNVLDGCDDDPPCHRVCAVLPSLSR